MGARDPLNDRIRLVIVLLLAALSSSCATVGTKAMFNPMTPYQYDAPNDFLCAPGVSPAACLSDITEQIADTLRAAFGDRPAQVSQDVAGHEVVVSVRDPIPAGEAVTGEYRLSASVRLYGLRWEGEGDARRLRGQVGLLGEIYRLDAENDFAWYVHDRINRLGELLDEVRTHVTEVTDALAP
jgi:hypothetical protein